MTPKPTTTAAPAPRASKSPVTLTIDIGGSGLKAMLLDAAGKPISERQRVPTPVVPMPALVIEGLDQLHKLLPDFDRVSIGYPGVVKHGITYTAANLHRSEERRVGKECRSRWSPY